MRATHFSQYLAFLSLFLLSHLALAQQPAPPGSEKKQLVELLPGAGVLIGDTLRGENIRKVKKDTLPGALQVKFKQGLTLMYSVNSSINREKRKF